MMGVPNLSQIYLGKLWNNYFFIVFCLLTFVCFVECSRTSNTCYTTDIFR